MDRLTIIETARRAAGLSQAELADRSRTAQSAISEYERRRKSPTLEVVERLLAAAGAEVMLVPAVTFERLEAPGVGSFVVPDRLWPLLLPLCFSRVRLPQLRRHTDREVWDLAVRADRVGLYGLLLCHGTEETILACVDGALLVDAWPELDLPVPVHEAWDPLVRRAKGRRATVRDVRAHLGPSSGPSSRSAPG